MGMLSTKTWKSGEFCLFVAAISLLSLLFLMISLMYSIDLGGPIVDVSLPQISASDSVREGKKQRLPQAIIIGTRKSGTRAVARFLEVNPSIRSAHEEVHFFDRPENYRLGLDWYRRQMPLTGESQLTIEKSPAYFVTRGVPDLIKAMNASIKLIVIMRDPVTRLISDFSQLLIKPNLSKHEHDEPTDNFAIRTGNGQELERLVTRQDGSIDEQRRIIRTGMYTVHLERWLAVFPRHQFHFVDGERLIEKPHEELQKIELFLGFENPLIRENHFVFSAKKGFYCLAGELVRSDPLRLNKTADVTRRELKCLGNSKGRAHASISQHLRDKLEAFYEPYNEYLSALTGINFV